MPSFSLLKLLFGDKTIKMGRKSVKKLKEKPAGCAGKGKQNKVNIGIKRTVESAKFNWQLKLRIEVELNRSDS